MDVLNALSKVPWSVWEEAVKREPEWVFSRTLSAKYPPQNFSVFMIVAGIDDYQLKERAETYYWPVLIESLLKRGKIPQTPLELRDFLWDFYKNERLYKNKLKRLDCFLESGFAGRLWEMPLEEIAEKFYDIWNDISKTLCPKSISWKRYRNKKTIVFAMKCLAIALLMHGIKDFEFNIPIPVDSRIKKLTFKLGLIAKDASDKEIQHLWQGVSERLREKYPFLTMLHLDSLLWQIAGLEDIEECQKTYKLPFELCERVIRGNKD